MEMYLASKSARRPHYSVVVQLTRNRNLLALRNLPRRTHDMRQHLRVNHVLRTKKRYKHTSTSSFRFEDYLLRPTRMIHPTRLRPHGQMIPPAHFDLERIRLDDILHSYPLVAVHRRQA
jgi:hypothetical protein